MCRQVFAAGSAVSMAMVSAMRLTWMPERRATVTAPKAVTSSLEKQRFPERACVGFGRLRPHRKQSRARYAYPDCASHPTSGHAAQPLDETLFACVALAEGVQVTGEVREDLEAAVQRRYARQRLQRVVSETAVLHPCQPE